MGKRWKDLNRDEKISRATSTTVGFVALFAAIVSYLHIRDLVLRNGYDTGTAYLAPFGVDGLIVGASLMLLTAHRMKLSAPLARLALWVGIGVTLAANVAYGWPHGLVGAVVSAWPAASFIVIVEAWIQLAKRKRKVVKPAAKTVKVPPSKPAVKRAPKAALNGSAAQEPTDKKQETPSETLQPVNDGKEVTAYQIRKASGCNHKMSMELRDIMVNDNVDLDTAKRIRKERMGHHAKTSQAQASLRLPAVTVP